MLDAIRGSEFRESTRERDAVRIDAPNLHPYDAKGQGADKTAWRPGSTQPGSHHFGDVNRMVDPFIARAVARLGGRQAAVMGLRYYAGLSRPETGARIGISAAAVGRSERAAIRTLRGLLGMKAA
jgi:DNA-directed RNA polymerase specialized sigma subunit